MIDSCIFNHLHHINKDDLFLTRYDIWSGTSKPLSLGELMNPNFVIILLVFSAYLVGFVEFYHVHTLLFVVFSR